MEPIYINSCTQTPANLAQLVRGTVKKGYNLIILLPAVAVFIAAVVTFVQQGFGFSSGLLLIAALALGITSYTASMRLADKAARRNRKKFGCDVTVTMRFTAQGITAHNEQLGTDASVTYEQVESVRESRDLYLLVLQEKMALMVAKDGFTLGDPAAFPAFLREKCGEKCKLSVKS